MLGHRVAKLLLAVTSAEAALQPVIVTKQGKLAGKQEQGTNVISYLGVPFAEPPTGALRFRPPVMHSGWNGTYEAFSQKPPCWQPEKMRDLLKWNFSEDCLYMNIHASVPDTTSGASLDLRPVLVNIHGGAFNTLMAVTGAKLAEVSGAVFAAPQYRLGVLGFLATEAPPPNFGMEDQRLALRWLKENVNAFGGDPTKIMIYGGSGGGSAVAGHLTMPASWGLYAAAGMDSPGGHQGWHAPGDPRVRQSDGWMSTNLALKDARSYALALGCAGANDLECLQKVAPSDLIAMATTSKVSRENRWFFSASLPVEGQYPLGQIASGAWNRVPLILGISSCEACKLATFRSGPVGSNLTREEFRDDVAGWGFSGKGGSEISPDTLEAWYGDRIAAQGYWRTVARIIADSVWACQGVLHAEAAVSTGGLEKGVYMYYFNYTPANYPYPGGTHGYIAQWLMQRRWRPTDGETQLMLNLGRFWAGMANSGTPNNNPNTTTHWPLFDPAVKNNVLVADVPMYAGSTLDVQRPECQHWKPYLGWPRSLIGSSTTTTSITSSTTSATLSMVPVCDGHVAESPVRGKLSNGKLVLDEGCEYRLFDARATADCLAGSWTIIAGASNAGLLFWTLVRTLTPREASDSGLANFQLGGAYVLDVLIEDGKIFQYSFVHGPAGGCNEVAELNITGNYSACKQHLTSFLSEVPYRSSLTRVTMFTWQFWNSIDVVVDVLDAVSADTSWRNAAVALVVQISTWYTLCNYFNFVHCPREDLKYIGRTAALDIFTSEMSQALTRLDTFCTVGQAGKRGCVVGTKSWAEKSGSIGQSFDAFEGALRTAMKSRASASLRFMDIEVLGEGMPEETLKGHGSQVLMHWAWQVLLNGFCPADLGARGTPSFRGPVCYAKDASLDLCPKYAKVCAMWGVCEMWHCMNTVRCELLTSSTVPFTTTTTMTTASDKVFSPVDGGDGRSCRGATIWDNDSTNYAVHGGVQSLDECQALCTNDPACKGIEYSAGRCEVWTKQIGSSIVFTLLPVTCLRYEEISMSTTSTTTTLNLPFMPVDGGDGHACRGEGPWDNAPANYILYSGIRSLSACKALCIKIFDCRGIEFSVGRCEVWTKRIDSSVRITAFSVSCFRLPFIPVDGGHGRACRGDGSWDNAPSNYIVKIGIQSLRACETLCAEEPTCKGIEYSAGRCELWTKQINASISISAFNVSCLQSVMIPFLPVDGGEGRACRGAGAWDNSPGNYAVHAGVPSLTTCKTMCAEEPACTGIEYSEGRCEVWKKYIGASVSITAFNVTCLHYGETSKVALNAEAAQRQTRHRLRRRQSKLEAAPVLLQFDADMRKTEL
jgi:carboxylesterase type B